MFHLSFMLVLLIIIVIYIKSGIFAIIIYYVSIQNFDKYRITYYIFMNNIKILISAFLLVISQLGFSQTDTNTVISDSITNIIPVFTTGMNLLESESESQDISGLLQSSRDVYTSQAGFNFSAARFRLRGYSSEHTTLLLNGIPVNDAENGWAIWSYWGGLNDMTRYPTNRTGVSSSHNTFGGIGGYSSISLRPTSKRSGHRFSYSSTNRAYRNRMMYSFNSGLTEKGWAISTCFSNRWSDEGYISGSYYSAMSYLLAIEKKINNSHSLSIVGFAAPTVQGRQGIAVEETYSLTENNFYNPYWGYQTQADGSRLKRNSRIRDNHKPYVALSHYFTIDNKSKLTTTVYSIFGKTGNTNLNWYDAKDPRPDYYKYLPSYFSDNPQMMASVSNDWTNNNTDVTQINWDGLYNANYKNLYTVNNVDGVAGESLTGNRSKYIVEEYRLDPKQFGLYSNYTKIISDNLHLAAGINSYMYSSRNYKKLDDLLGGDFWIDIDQFAEQDFEDENVAQNDLQNTNNVIYQGDEFGYNYNININRHEVFGQLDYTNKKIESYFGLTTSQTSFWRDGKMQNGRFPDNSLGESEKQNFLNYGIKTGLVYKITGRHLIRLNATYSTKAPYARNAYVSPRTRDQIVPNLESTEIISGDIAYVFRLPNIKGRLTGFYTQINNQVWARSFYHDEYRTFVNYMMTNVDQLFTGIEFGIEGKITSSWIVNAAFTTGDYIYNSRPLATITRDNSEEVVAENKTIYLKNYKIGGMPQTASSIGLKYNSPKYWYAGINANYFADIYLGPNPDRRTEEAVSLYAVGDPQIDGILDPEKLENGYTLNLYVGKSWKIHKYDTYIRLNININNVLNNTSFRTGGFEQLRYDVTDIDRFPSKYGYMYGLTYFAMLSYLF